MRATKIAPMLTLALCVPGVALRAMHFTYGFDVDSGLPSQHAIWLWCCAGLFVVAAILLCALCAPLRRQAETPFETLFGTRKVSFRMMMVITGMLFILGGAVYFYFNLTGTETVYAIWEYVVSYLYAAAAVGTGFSLIGLAQAQGGEMNEKNARLTLLPLLWSCLHLLVTYRATDVDPKLPAYAFGLISDALLVLAVYHFARMLYGRPRPAAFAVCSLLALLISVADLGGYGLASLMGAHAIVWSGKALLRDGLSIVCSVALLAQVWLLVRTEQERVEEPLAQEHT